MGAEGGMWKRAMTAVGEKFKQKSPVEKAEAQLKDLDTQEQAENTLHKETIDNANARHKAAIEKIQGAREKAKAVVESGRLDKEIARLSAEGRKLSEKMTKAVTAYNAVRVLLENTLKAITEDQAAAKTAIEGLRQVLVTPLEQQRQPIIDAIAEARAKKTDLDAIIRGIKPQAAAA